MSTFDQGKPPKSADQIRLSLESIRKTADVENRVGPDVGGLKAEDQITIATFHDRDVAASFQQWLHQAGIFSSLVRHRRDVCVTVDFEDHERSAKLFHEHRLKCPDRWPRGQSKRYDFLIFGLVIGGAFGAILFVDAWHHELAITIPLTFGAIGALAGHFIDCLRMRLLQTGRLRMGVWEFLVLATLPALVIFVCRFFPAIFRE